MRASEIPARPHERCGCDPCCRAWRASFAPAPDWPVDPTGRLICTTERPMPAKHEGQWLHPEAVDDGGCSDGCCDDYRCPACGERWRARYGH
jgi:hypothetical protein